MTGSCRYRYFFYIVNHQNLNVNDDFFRFTGLGV